MELLLNKIKRYDKRSIIERFASLAEIEVAEVIIIDKELYLYQPLIRKKHIKIAPN